MLEDLVVYTPMYVTLIWALILASTKNENNKAKHFLSIFMFVAFLLYLSHAVFFKQNVLVYYFFDPLYIFATLSVYPLYYWYVKLLTVETAIRLYNLRMLLPAVVLSASSFLIYQMMNDEEAAGYIYGFLLNHEEVIPDTLMVKLQMLNYMAVRTVFGIQVIFFLIYGKKLVSDYNIRIANFYSNLESKSLLWVKFFLYSLIATAIMSTVFNVIGRSAFLESRIHLFIPSFIFSILLFFIGLIGSMQNHTVKDLESDSQSHSFSGASTYTIEQLSKGLLELFSQKGIYRNPDLKITDVAGFLGTNRTYVSELINNEFNCSFVEFVNRYRHNEAKRLLSNFEPERFSIGEIAEYAGFGSPGTFIRVFRQFEGTTPGRYREQMHAGHSEKAQPAAGTKS
ncbi:MAG: helix-turn-helix transcriptional regulator [Mariniphaga sp.]